MKQKSLIICSLGLAMALSSCSTKHTQPNGAALGSTPALMSSICQAPASVAGKTFTYYPKTHVCGEDVCANPRHQQPWSLTWRNSNERKETSANGWMDEYKYVKTSETEAVIYWFSHNEERGNDRTMHLHFTSPTGGTASFEVDGSPYMIGSSGTGTFTLL